MRRRIRCTCKLEADLIDVTPVPTLPGLVAPDDRMAGDIEVGGGVLSRRLLATTDVGTGLAGAEMNPISIAGGEAVLTALTVWNRIRYRVEMSAVTHRRQARSSNGDRQVMLNSERERPKQHEGREREKQPSIS